MLSQILAACTLAKRLIDETNLSMTNIAFASGFGCVRRFNAVIGKTYKRTPTQIRRLHKTVQQSDDYLFHLRFRPPFNWQSMLAYFAARAIPGVEAVGRDNYRRSISVDRSHGFFEAKLDEVNDALSVRVQIGDPHSLYPIIERIRRMFDLNGRLGSHCADPWSDRKLSSLIAAEPGLRVPRCWNTFELTVRAILGERSSAKTAAILAGRIVASLGKPIPMPPA